MEKRMQQPLLCKVNVQYNINTAINCALKFEELLPRILFTSKEWCMHFVPSLYILALVSCYVGTQALN